MNSEEQTLIDDLFGRLKQAQDPSVPRDAQAQARIAEHLQQQPAAPYYMAQAILVQEAALKRLDEQNKQLQAELNQAKAQFAATAPSNSGSFLSSIFGSGTRGPQPVQNQAAASAPASGGGWREPSRPSFNQPDQQQGFNAAPAQAPARGGASSFLGGALQTAAGVAGGVMLAQGISSLFNHHSQPEEVVEVIKDEPAPASDSGGWGSNDDQRLTADNSSYGNDQGGFMDTDYGSDDGGFFGGDDDSFV
ncbi:DUF2076 domain-containing protein [Pseudomonas rubra]|uniref:DUF2076 domain-containing protein n=1 Tax=Pseudomonas rubra TaxID=2942627 RepID=A0ABT5PB12_9PSED|nr:DUF2076 domain-containing protein [Pseudomonas rubra]MDD1015496.1 DUF2076 domain-containing protein [Pseudomonas rubra]MDD1041662.1 DUF2076 domain-containing protein [Pseudomonas rubra]MDD1157094.1 DUF2076 domain-containing protein [Pseudomonas rubra]